MKRLAALLFILVASQLAVAEDPVFSGPQIGEKLAPFSATSLRGESSKETKFDITAEAKGKPVLVIFWHELGRPGFGLIRTLIQYTSEKKEQGIHSAIVVLSDDPEAPKFSRVLGYIPKGVPFGVSADGKDGPGAYGLNRNVRMTILVGKDNKVTGNFALVQPSIQSDGPKILKAIAETIGEEPPELKELLAKGQQRMRGAAAGKKMRQRRKEKQDDK